MVNVQQTPTPQQVKALMRQLRRIASALEEPRSQPLRNEPSLAAAARNLDYLALRQLMGRVRLDDEPVAIGSARRKRGPGGATAKSIITLESLPPGAVKLAVFTQRGDPAEVVPLTSHPTPYVRGTSKPQDYLLTTVTNEQVITRLEFRRNDDRPIALGPRLAVV